MALPSRAAVRRLVETLGPAAVCTQDGPALKDTPFWGRDQKVIVSHVGDRKRLIGVDLVNEILHCEKQLIPQNLVY